MLRNAECSDLFGFSCIAFRSSKLGIIVSSTSSIGLVDSTDSVDAVIQKMPPSKPQLRVWFVQIECRSWFWKRRTGKTASTAKWLSKNDDER